MRAPSEALIRPHFQNCKDYFRTRVTAPTDYPGRNIWGDTITTWHRQIHVLGKISSVLNGLIQRKQFQALRFQIRIRIRKPEEPVLKQYDSAVFLLSYLSEDGLIRDEWPAS